MVDTLSLTKRNIILIIGLALGPEICRSKGFTLQDPLLQFYLGFKPWDFKLVHYIFRALQQSFVINVISSSNLHQKYPLVCDAKFGHTREPLFPWQKERLQVYRSYKSGTADQDPTEYSPLYLVTHQRAFVSLTRGQSTGLQIIQVRDCWPTPNTSNRVQSLLPCHTADSLCFPDKWAVYLHIYLCKSGTADQHPTDYSHDRRTWLQFKIPCQCHTVESLCFSGNVLNIIQVEHCRLTPNRVQSLVPCHTPDSFCSPDKVRSAKISDCIRHFSNQCGILSAKTGSQNQSDNHCNWSEDTRPSILVTRLLELY